MAASGSGVTLHVREVEPDDLPIVLELMREHARYERADPPSADAARLAEALFVCRRLFAWVAVIDGERAGYMTATREFSTWRARSFMHMDCLYVRADHRGAGAGARLMAALKSFCTREGIDEVQWQTPDWNIDAARFYERVGAVQRIKRRFVWLLASL